MRFRPTITKPFLFLVAALALALTGTAIAHHGDEGFHHDDPAGTIASFDAAGGILTIDLADGGEISGKVTRFTWIDCDDHDGHRGWHRGRHVFHGFGDDDEHGWSHHSHCSTDDLTAGATVDDAALVLRDGRAFFWKVDLDQEGDSGAV